MKSKRASYREVVDNFTSPPRNINISVFLEGDGLQDANETLFLCLVNEVVVLEQKWEDGVTINEYDIPVNLNDSKTAEFIADTPLVLLLRAFNGKTTKDPYPLLNNENRSGANIDILPLLLGETLVNNRITFVNIMTGESIGCFAEVSISTEVGKDCRLPLLLTMISATCLPQQTKEGTAFLAALCLDGIREPVAVPFGLSSTSMPNKFLIWASLSSIGYAAQSTYRIPIEDNYVPPELDIGNKLENCSNENWGVCRRILVDYDILRKRIETHFFFEMAGVPKTGKVEVRSRYMAFVDTAVLLVPNENNVSISSKLYYFNEAGLPENVSPLLDLPASSAKTIIRETDDVMDEHGHMSFITLRFDIMEPLIPKSKMSLVLDYNKEQRQRNDTMPKDIYFKVSPDDQDVDAINVNKIRKQEYALNVHSELNSLACTGAVLMNQSIKKTAANRLLTTVKCMLKQFSPNKCDDMIWQDVVTAQHSAARRAVTASFSPQPPLPLVSSVLSAARSRLAGDIRIAKIITDTNLENSLDQVKTLLIKALRCIDEGYERKAQKYLKEALCIHPRNKFLLWALGGQEFYKITDDIDRITAIFQLAIKSQNNDNISKAIGWAALHALQHYSQNYHAAFVAVKKMRKCYELPTDWQKFLKDWIEYSGEEEYLWNPHIINIDNPLIICSAFFLCLKAHKFSEIILNCVEYGCAVRGAKMYKENKHIPDITYLRAVSLLTCGQIDKAMNEIKKGVSKYGPSSMLSQLKATCLLQANGWDGNTEQAFMETEKSGAEPSATLLLRAALGGIETNAAVALQRAAKAHKAAPCAHSALVLSKVYLHMEEIELGEQWAAAAVNTEPNLSDGWAFLAYIAIQNKNIEKGRSLIRTALQVGPISDDIQVMLQSVMTKIPVEGLPESLMKDLCLCHFH